MVPAERQKKKEEKIVEYGSGVIRSAGASVRAVWLCWGRGAGFVVCSDFPMYSPLVVPPSHLLVFFGVALGLPLLFAPELATCFFPGMIELLVF